MTHHKFQTQLKFEPWARVKLLQSSKITTRPTTQRIQRLKQCKHHEEGPEIYEIWGEIVAAATIGDYLVNLDLWAINL